MSIHNAHLKNSDSEIQRFRVLYWKKYDFYVNRICLQNKIIIHKKSIYLETKCSCVDKSTVAQ